MILNYVFEKAAVEDNLRRGNHPATQRQMVVDELTRPVFIADRRRTTQDSQPRSLPTPTAPE